MLLHEKIVSQFTHLQRYHDIRKYCMLGIPHTKMLLIEIPYNVTHLPVVLHK